MLTASSQSFGKIYQYFNVKYTYLIALVIFEGMLFHLNPCSNTAYSLFSVGSVICAAATSSPMLIIGRAVAGAGASALFSGGMTIIGFAVPLDKRPIYLASLSSMFGIASVVGPIMGGALTDKVSWRWCFYVSFIFHWTCPNTFDCRTHHIHDRSIFPSVQLHSWLWLPSSILLNASQVTFHSSRRLRRLISSVPSSSSARLFACFSLCNGVERVSPGLLPAFGAFSSVSGSSSLCSSSFNSTEATMRPSLRVSSFASAPSSVVHCSHALSAWAFTRTFTTFRSTSKQSKESQRNNLVFAPSRIWSALRLAVS